MPALPEVQRELRDYLLADHDQAAPSWVLAPHDDASERLDVYRGTVLDTLVRALRITFPAVHRIVGAEFFEGAGRIFATGNLPQRADLNDYGEAFPTFLESFEPCSQLPYLADVARLDWATARALHAKDAAPVDLQSLAGIDDEAARSMCFTAHPSLSLLRSSFPVHAIWRSVLDGEDAAMSAIDLASGPVHLLVERGDDRVQVLEVPAHEWPTWIALLQGQPLSRVVAMAGSGLDVPACLAAHLSAGRLVAFRFSSSDGGSP